MKINTCEQYVLTQLFEQQDENDRLLTEITDLRKKLSELQAALSTRVEKAVREAGRKAIAEDCIGYASVKDDGKPRPYGDWLMAATQYAEAPEGLTMLDVLKEFDGEFRAIYEEKLRDAGFYDEAEA